MYFITVFLFFSIIHQGFSTHSYHIQLNDVDLNSCNNAKHVFDILSFNLWSDSLEIPGYFDAALSFNVKQNYSAVDATYSIKVERKLGPVWIDMPCITEQCTDQSLCTLIKTSCSSKKYCKNHCQLSTGSHTLDMIHIPLKSNLFEHEILTTGQYKFKIKFYDARKTTIACFDGYITLKKAQNFY